MPPTPPAPPAELTPRPWEILDPPLSKVEKYGKFAHKFKISHLKSTLRVHDEVSSDVVEHDRVFLAPLLELTPNHTERLHIYHSVSEIHTKVIFKIRWVLLTTSNRVRQANQLLSSQYHPIDSNAQKFSYKAYPITMSLLLWIKFLTVMDCSLLKSPFFLLHFSSHI